MKSILFGILFSSFIAVGVYAQSAVYFCPDTTSYGYCYGAPEVDQCALDKCQEYGGTNCQQIVDCKKKGYGAIALGENSEGAAVIGTSCGFGNLAGAKNEAVKQCTKYGGINCQVKNTWNG
ncbi:MAG: DUF4189 domain-containing protein [Leptospiraceae bacterium]|nr:DUF4189 domain-containing protein [Leptospiraceae bacterium]MCK6380388.1 DUF4189 domain-containing protein [Leptospiraceae bacterium]NUM41775.1 DUF4189 domain-containing protein [Leptospiraceae bacterium]